MPSFSITRRERRFAAVVNDTISGSASRSNPNASTARAADFMSTPVVTVDEFDRIDEVMRVLRERSIHHLPVVRNQRLVGIITPSDVIRFLVEELLPPTPEAG